MLELSEVCKFASEAGFDDCGVARAMRLEQDFVHFYEWIASDYHGSMGYMSREMEKRIEPQALVPGTKSVLVCLMSYHKESKQVANAPFVSQSGLSRSDYHDVMKRHLLLLEDKIVQRYGCEVFCADYQHLFCDTAPVLERRWAQLSGLGQIGKNHQLISERFGSLVHIGILFLCDEFDRYSNPCVQDLCRDCDRCVKSCPTGVLKDKLFDARKCVSYLTIERKEPLEERYKKAVEGVLYGCDRCAEVCPYNQRAEYTKHYDLQADEKILGMTTEDWQRLSRRQKLRLLHRLAKTD